MTRGEIKTKSKGAKFAEFTPWYKAWVQYVNEHYLEICEFLFSTPKKLERTIQELSGFPEVDVDTQ